MNLLGTTERDRRRAPLCLVGAPRCLVLLAAAKQQLDITLKWRAGVRTLTVQVGVAVIGATVAVLPGGLARWESVAGIVATGIAADLAIGVATETTAAVATETTAVLAATGSAAATMTATETTAVLVVTRNVSAAVVATEAIMAVVATETTAVAVATGSAEAAEAAEAAVATAATTAVLVATGSVAVTMAAAAATVVATGSAEAAAAVVPAAALLSKYGCWLKLSKGDTTLAATTGDSSLHHIPLQHLKYLSTEAPRWAVMGYRPGGSM